MTKQLQTHVRKLAKAAPVAELADALQDLVLLRLKKRAIAEINANLSRAPRSLFDDEAAKRRAAAEALKSLPRKARSTRRRGRNQNYVSTGKTDISRLGTFRHYMIRLVREHSCTWDAERAHAVCDNPKFAKNRLDFAWMAAEGYIEFVN